MSNKPKFAKNKRNAIKKEYDKMVKAKEPLDTPKFNAYSCYSCGNNIKTVEFIDGVTPMFIFCNRCDSRMTSAMYRIEQDHEDVAKEWYCPTFAEYCKLSDSEKSHVEQGGLLLRDIE